MGDLRLQGVRRPGKGAWGDILLKSRPPVVEIGKDWEKLRRQATT